MGRPAARLADRVSRDTVRVTFTGAGNTTKKRTETVYANYDLATGERLELP